MTQQFRGVVWPREAIGATHRYVIVGILVADEPIPELDGNQFVLDGDSAGMAEAMRVIQQHPSDFRGDANAVLTQLNQLVAL